MYSFILTLAILYVIFAVSCRFALNWYESKLYKSNYILQNQIHHFNSLGLKEHAHMYEYRIEVNREIVKIQLNKIENIRQWIMFT